MQLDPARARVEAALRLLDRRLVQVEPDERDQPPVRPRGEGERAVVRGRERRVAVGLVEAEHERPRDPVPRHDGLERVVVADHPVDVVSEVEVRVEDVRARREQALQLGVVELAQLERAFESVTSLPKANDTRAVGSGRDR